MNTIGIENQTKEIISKELNGLLATYEVFYQNLRACHWNVKGEHFFELHLKFEELYSDAQLKIDEIAERILTLGMQPLDSYSAYLDQSAVKEFSGVSDGRTCVSIVRENLNTILSLERMILEKSDESCDSGTSDLMTQYISAQEKVVWMLTAYLS